MDTDKISTSIEFNSYYEAPLYSNTTIGHLRVFVNDTQYFTVDILNSNEIIKKNVFDYFLDFVFNYWKYLYINVK